MRYGQGKTDIVSERGDGDADMLTMAWVMVPLKNTDSDGPRTHPGRRLGRRFFRGPTASLIEQRFAC